MKFIESILHRVAMAAGHALDDVVARIALSSARAVKMDATGDGRRWRPFVYVDGRLLVLSAVGLWFRPTNDACGYDVSLRCLAFDATAVAETQQILAGIRPRKVRRINDECGDRQDVEIVDPGTKLVVGARFRDRNCGEATILVTNPRFVGTSVEVPSWKARAQITLRFVGDGIEWIHT